MCDSRTSGDTIPYGTWEYTPVQPYPVMVYPVEEKVGVWLVCIRVLNPKKDVAKEVTTLLEKCNCQTSLIEVEKTSDWALDVWFLVRTWEDVERVSSMVSSRSRYDFIKAVYKRLTMSEGREVTQ